MASSLRCLLSSHLGPKATKFSRALIIILSYSSGLTNEECARDHDYRYSCLNGHWDNPAVGEVRYQKNGENFQNIPRLRLVVREVLIDARSHDLAVLNE